MKAEIRGFSEFIQEQGIVGLAVGFIIGSAVGKVVSSITNDLINPLIGLVLGAAGNLNEQFIMLGTAKILWGHFVATTVDFIVIAAVVYYGVKLLGIEGRGKKKEDKKK